MWKNKPVSDIDALWQALEPFAQNYTITRQAIRSYNERGRVSNTETKDFIRAFIQPGGQSINTDQQGKGRWVKADYSLYTVVPHYVSIGDIIHTPQWGDLKVHSLQDQRYQGMMSANLVRTTTTQHTSRKENCYHNLVLEQNSVIVCTTSYFCVSMETFYTLDSFLEPMNNQVETEHERTFSGH